MIEHEIEDLAEKLLKEYPTEEWKTTVWDLVRKVNSANFDKLLVKDLKKLFRVWINQASNKMKIEKQKGSSNQLMHLSTLLKLKISESKWIIKDLLPENGITILSGNPGSFKTWSTLHFALCIAQGKPVYNHFETTKGNILIIDEEDGIGLLQQRAKSLSADGKSNIYFLVMSGFKIDDEDNDRELFEYIKKYRIKVVILDSLVRIHRGEENSSSAIALVFEVLRKLNRKGVSVLLNHHHRKKPIGKTFDSQPMRGSSDILAAIDCHMQIDHKDDKLIIAQNKNRFGEEIKPFEVDIKKEDDKIFFNYVGDAEIAQDKSSEGMGIILDLLVDKNDWLTRAEIDEGLNGKVGKNNIGVALTTLVSSGDVKCRTGDKRKKTYRINNDDYSDEDTAF
jgi:KaiC/GvpD/RAD55 family RecA-like ATPase